jgi:hypothetical protein
MSYQLCCPWGRWQDAQASVLSTATGLAAAGIAGAIFDLKGMSTAEMKRYLRVYCGAYPSADYSDAVEALMKSLPRVKR